MLEIKKKLMISLSKSLMVAKTNGDGIKLNLVPTLF